MSYRNNCELLANELDSKIFAEPRHGLVWELLSIGYALGNSNDLAATRVLRSRVELLKTLVERACLARLETLEKAA
jgi:hypothetical protein